MPVRQPSVDVLPDCFRVEWAPGAVRPTPAVAAIAPAGAAVRLRCAGIAAVDALLAGATVAEATAATGVDVRPLVRVLLDTGLVHPRPSGCRFSVEDMTVVIPAHNAASQLVTLLDALGSRRVIVVDDGSTDDTRAVAQQRGATVVSNPRAVGPAGARNRGAALSSTALVAFIDADCRPHEGWLEQLVRHFDDPVVAAAAPRIVAARDDGPALARYEAARSVLDRGPHESRVAPSAIVRLVPTAALVARRDALDGVGGFDESLRFGEDQDLVYRLTAAGWRIRYDPATTVAHDHRTSLGAFVRRRAGYGTPAGVLARRYGTLEVAARLPSPALVPLRRELRELGVPGTLATDLLRRSALHSARSLGNAATRAWLVPAAVAGARWRWLAPAVVAAVIARHTADWRSRRPSVPLSEWVALRVVDEGALALGIWWGAARARTTAPLRPAFATPVTRPAADGLFIDAVICIP